MKLKLKGTWVLETLETIETRARNIRKANRPATYKRHAGLKDLAQMALTELIDASPGGVLIIDKGNVGAVASHIGVRQGAHYVKTRASWKREVTKALVVAGAQPGECGSGSCGHLDKSRCEIYPVVAWK